MVSKVSSRVVYKIRIKYIFVCECEYVRTRCDNLFFVCGSLFVCVCVSINTVHVCVCSNLSSKQLLNLSLKKSNY